jgi:amino acid adenylation domain-containing protein
MLESSMEEFWAQNLRGVKQCTYPPSVPSAACERLERVIEKRLECSWPPRVYHAAWALLLSRYEDSSTDVVYGITSAAPDKPAAPVVVPLRLTWLPDTFVSEFLDDVELGIASSTNHVAETIQDIAKVSLDASIACGFCSALSIEAFLDEQEWHSHEFTIETQLTLFLRLISFNGSTRTTVVYDASLIDDQQIQNLLSHWEFIAGQLGGLDLPKQSKLCDISYFSPWDRDQILKWNHEPPPKIVDCVHSLFAEQVKLRPSAPAVCSWDINLTYNELDDLSLRLAGYLLDQDVGLEQIVPCCFDKSSWVIVAMLAILKAGGACTHLGTSFPVSRMRSITQSCGAGLLLCDAKANNTGQVKELGCNVIVIDEAFVRSLPIFDPVKLPIVSPNNAACVIFTSGSTGTPKGSILEHASFCTTSEAIGVKTQLGPTSRVLQFSAYPFGTYIYAPFVPTNLALTCEKDASMGDILFSLMRGACVCCPSEHDRLNNLESAARRMNVNWALLTPSVLRMLKPACMPTLKTILTGGEAPTKDNLLVWADKVSLHLATGPSECTVYCSATDPVEPSSNPQSIGTALGCRTWIVEPTDHTKLASIGCVGEMIVEGRTVARGYINDAERTTMSFIEEPKWLPAEEHPSPRRLYKSGDLARYNSDGTMVFVGRKDTQVKILGQRVELAEIDYQIRSRMLSLNDAVSYAGDVLQQQKRHAVVAFLVYQECSSSTVDKQEELQSITNDGKAELIELQASLATSIPSYMIPTLFVPIRKMPLMVSGKVDRPKLRQILENLTPQELVHYSLSEEAVPKPLGGNEQVLRELWARILGIEESLIGSNSHFIRLGGDSIKAMQLVAEASKIGVNLAVRDVLSMPQLSSMAEAILRAEFAAHDSTTECFSLLDPIWPLTSIQNFCALTCNIKAELIEDVYPCTPLQEGLFSLSLKTPQSYVMRNSYQLSGDIDLNQFMTAWETVYQTIDILRTRIVSYEGQLLQVVIKDFVEWHCFENLDQYWAHDSQVSMGFGNSLMRFGIIRPKEASTPVFTVTGHHALYDGFVLSMVFKQVAALYQRTTVEKLVSFKSFVSYLSSLPRSPSADFWKSTLEGTETPSWPIQGAHSPHLKTVRGSHRLPSSSSTEHTLPTIIQGAYAMLLSTYSDSQDVVFGLTVTGRNAPLPNILRIAGPTLETVPFRAVLDRNQSIEQFLNQIQNCALDVEQHAHIGLRNIRRCSPDAEAACSFRTLLVIQPIREEAGNEIGLSMINTASEVVGTYSLTIECQMLVGGLDIVAEYMPDVFQEQEAIRITDQLGHLIEQLLRNTKISCGELELISAKDLRQLSVWNSRSDIPRLQCIDDIIKANMDAFPDADAICAWDESLTYGELDVLSARVASRLRNLGVSSGVIVPICADKSAWVVVSILGILRAGGAFVTLDPSNPHDRLLDIVRQIEAELIIVSPRIEKEWTGLVEHILCCSYEMRNWSTENSGGIMQSRDPHSLAYVVFTSGSTGRPKGVLIEHSSFVSASLSRASAIRRNSKSRVYQFSSFAFDTSCEDILTTLLVRGTVCIPSEAERKSNLAESINKYNANAVDLTPSVSNLISPTELSTLETLILGGEKMTSAQVNKWAPHVTLINTYGPAELSIVATTAAPSIVGSEADNIGFATCGHAWIVDPYNHHRLVPIGAIGELLMEGPLLAKGYLNHPEKTNAAFVTGLRWASSQTRFYKTGDLVSVREDGSLTIIGRKDTQLKVHGQRVELGEIEQNLQYLPDVSGAAVEYLKLAHYPQSLVCFVCFGQQQQQSQKMVVEMSDDLRGRFQAIEHELTLKLPQYMIPSFFIPLQRLPTTLVGKLDRKALRALVEQMRSEELLAFRLADATAYQVPATASEITLQAMWAEIFHVPANTISTAAHFFRFGGDSISVMHLSALARQHNYLLSVAAIFKNPILRDMAAALVDSGESFQKDTVNDPPAFSLLPRKGSLTGLLAKIEPCFQEDEIEDIYPCTPLQEGFMVTSSRQPQAYVAQQVFKLEKGIDVARFRNAWTRVVEANTILRTRIVYVDGPGFLQLVIRRPGSWIESNSLNEYLAADKATTMDYGSALTRFCIVQVPGKQENYFVYTAHHATFDEYTHSAILKQVMAVYHNAAHEIPQTAPFSRFIGYLKDQNTSKSKSYWDTQLRGTPTTVFLAPQDPTTPFARKEMTVRHKVALQQQSRTGNKSASATMAILIRAAWALVVCAFSEADDVLFGTLLSGRSAPVSGISEMVAPTITTVPIRFIRNKNQTVGQLLSQMQQQAISMIPYEHDGLQSIQISHPIASKFHNILVVHPDEKTVPCLDPLKPHIGMSPGTEKSNEQGYYKDSLILDCFLKDEEIQLNAVYDANVVSESGMMSILYTFGLVIQQLFSGSDDTLVSDLDLCSAQDRQQILAWNSELPLRKETLIHELVAKQLAIRPTAPAIESWDGVLTFKELDEWSERLACHLAGLGLDSAQETIIPLCFEKSLYAVVSMLAVLKFGGAYASLDPTFPRSRLQDMAEQTKAEVVLSSSLHHHKFEGTLKHVVVVDRKFLDELLPPPLIRILPIKKINPESPAIIVFTSGSTGKPKGVVIMHGAFCTLSTELGPLLNLGPETRALQFAAYAFDASNGEIFMTLIQGGCVCIPSSKDRLNDLAGVVTRMCVNWLGLTPTATTLIQGPASVPTVTTLSIGGEAARKDIIDTWAAKVDLFNTYGPAEATVWASMAKFMLGSPPNNIGKGNSCLMWLVEPDNHQKLVPIGAIGEICLEGPLLAKGYLHDAEKTKQAFIEGIAWLGDAGRDRRFYRTGDLARYNPDGSLNYCGRMGTMVKVRGQRLELGDVEANIKQLASQQTSVCVELVASPGLEAQLVAFITMDAASIPQPQLPDRVALPMTDYSRNVLKHLHSSLTSVIPPYMIPSLYIPLMRMPTTASGKTDRKVLRTLLKDFTDSQVDSYRFTSVEKRQPVIDKEIKMRALWAQVLGKEETSIGADDNFFEAGGNSLAAIRLAIAARKSHLAVTVSDVFLHPILSDIARKATPTLEITHKHVEPFSLLPKHIDRSRLLPEQTHAQDLSLIQDAYPCTPLQEGLLSLSFQYWGAYIAFYTFRMPGDVDINRFKRAWESAVENFDILRTRIVSTEDVGFLQVVHKTVNILWHYSASVADAVAIDRLPSSFNDLELAKFGLVTGGKEQFFVLRLHHAAFDEHTLEMLLGFVEDTYHGRKTQQIEHYNTYVAYSLASNTKKCEDFWLKELRGFENQHFLEDQIILSKGRDGASFRHTITLGRFSGLPFTIPTYLQAAWAIVLGRYLQSQDVVYGLTVSGRDASVHNISNIGGPTITTFPRRVGLEPRETLADFLAGFQRQTAAATSYGHFGLQNIARLPGLRDVCDFKNLLIVQDGSIKQKEFIMQEHALASGQQYHAIPLVIECTVSEITNGAVTIDFMADFDLNAISQWYIERLMYQFAQVMRQLYGNNSILVGDVELWSPEDLGQVQAWHNTTKDGSNERYQEKVWIMDLARGPKLGPVGALGELCIELPDSQTNERKAATEVDFVECPIYHMGNLSYKVVKVYRTGKLVKYNHDGTLCHFGHTCSQAKLRGRRIDLDRIEHVIERSSGRLSGVVADVGKFADSTVPELILFLDANSDPNLPGTVEELDSPISQELTLVLMELGQKLGHHLPTFMVPSAYILLKSTPRTPSGKVDRKRLQDIVATLHNSIYDAKKWEQRVQRLPLTDMEMVMQKLWVSVLNVPASSISASDSWLLVGGDSISAMRLVSSARTRNIIITVADVLRSSCLAQLAKAANAAPSSDITVHQLHENERKLRVKKTMKNVAFAAFICKSLRAKISEVEDIVPATDFQVAMFTAGLTRTRGWSNYITYDPDEVLNLSRVSAALQQVIAHNPVLRTAFLARHCSLQQVVLASINLEVQQIHTAESLKEASAKWLLDDVKFPSTLDKPVLRCVLINTNDESRVIIGVSHALYDGISLAMLSDDFVAAFGGEALTLRPSFAPFALQISQHDDTQALEYWRNLLRGSSVTNVAKYAKPAFNRPFTDMKRRQIARPDLTSHGFTTTTLIKSAWSLVLAHWANTTDVTFGHLVAGRGFPFPNVTEIVGPCVNLVPIRLQLTSTRKRDLLWQAHNQHLEGLGYENVGFSKIIRECTDWPRWTRFSSVLQYQNIENSNAIFAENRLNKNSRFGLMTPSPDSADVWIETTPSPDREMLQVDLNYSELVMTNSLADELLDELCQNIEMLAAGIDGHINLPQTPQCFPRLPIQDAYVNGVNGFHSMEDEDEEGYSPYEKIVRDSWRSIGLCDVGDDTPFYEVTGNLLPAVELAALFKKQFMIGTSLEELVEKPTIRLQARLLAQS